MSDRHRFRNLLGSIPTLQSDQLCRLAEVVAEELKARDLENADRQREERRRELGIFLELDPDYTFTFFRALGRTARPRHGFEPLLVMLPRMPETWHLVEPDVAEGVTFPVRRTSIKLACLPGPVRLEGSEVSYRTGLTNCVRCFGSGKIAVAVSRPKGSE